MTIPWRSLGSSREKVTEGEPTTVRLASLNSRRKTCISERSVSSVSLMEKTMETLVGLGMM